MSPPLRLACLALAFAAAAPARAQSSTRDSVPRDTLSSRAPRDSVRPVATDGMMLIFPVAAMAAFAAAPLAFIGERGPSELPFARDHAAASLSLGGYFTNGRTWTQSANVEVVHHDRVLEADVEQYDGPAHLRYSTVRVGLLFHPRRRSAGGVTLGYQLVDRDRRQRGVEVGLPLVAFGGGGGPEFRFVPTYVFAPRNVFWSLRSDVSGPIARSPFFTGLRADVRSVTRIHNRSIEYSSGTVAVLLGRRF